MRIFLLCYLFLFNSCSFFKRRIPADEEVNLKERYYLNDKSGKFLVETESGISKKSNFVFKKKVLLEDAASKGPLEQLISISKKGKLKLKEGGTLQVLGPIISQYTVWFEGKKYFSEMKLSSNNKLSIHYTSPESGKSGVKDIVLPKSTGVRCFFSQLVDCVRATGFLSQSQDKGAGKMHFQVLWDGYPFLQDQYTGLKEIPFSQAVLEFDGKNKNDERRYTLQAAGQSIFYFVGNKNELKKMFWVSEGLTLTKMDHDDLPRKKERIKKNENIYADEINSDVDFESE